MRNCISENEALLYLQEEIAVEDETAISEHIAQCTICEMLLAQTSDVELIAGMERSLEKIKQEAFDASIPDHIVDRLQRLALAFSYSIRPENNEAASTLSAISHARNSEGFDSQLRTPLHPQNVFQSLLDSTELFFHRFVLLRELGQGGMGVVYKAFDTHLDRMVALKMTIPLEGNHSANFMKMERFSIEAKAMARLNHVNIISVLEIGEAEQCAYLVMPYLPGGTLSDRLRKFDTPGKIVSMFANVVSAVQHAHENEVLHRDLKPANILFTKDNEPVVADFGLAKLTEQSMNLTIPGIGLGTPPYMAPEQTPLGNGNVTPVSDIWSLGVLLYELLTKKRPFEGETNYDVYTNIIRKKPIPIRQLDQSIDRNLEAIVMKCLQKRPSDRFQSAEALYQELDRWQKGKPILTRRDNFWEGTKRWVRAHPFFALLTVQLLLLLLAAPVVYYRLHPDRPLWEQQARLEKRKPIQILGPNGEPSWYRWVWSKQSQAGVGDDGHFVIHSWEKLALLELIPDPKTDRYRLEAEIRHLRGDTTSQAGFYFFHDVHEGIEGRVDAFIRLSFNDLINVKAMAPRPLPKHVVEAGNRIQFESQVAFRHPGRTTASATTNSFYPKSHHRKPAGIRGIDWIKVRIDVTPEGITVRFGDQQFDTVPFSKMITSFETQKRWVNELTKEDPQFDIKLQSSLGLFVCRGIASYRNVRFTPLDP